jgi:two-component sensor histidine kinase
MMATGGVWFGRLDSLGARIGALLSLAILPLGLIAIVQSYRVLDEATQRLDQALIGEALRVTRGERSVIHSALGAAQAIATTLPDNLEPLERCRNHLADVTEGLETIHFAGFIPVSGVMTCTSAGDAERDFSDSPVFLDLISRPRLLVQATERGYVTQKPAVLITVPVTERDGVEIVGFLTTSLTHSTLAPDADINPDRVPIDILTFNEEGQILTATLAANASDLLPQNHSLVEFVGRRSTLFRDTSAGGRELIYSVTPIVEGTVYALTVWPQSIGTGPGDLLRWTLPTILLPVLMWIASMSVAYFAVHRLVIGHVRRLRKRMRVFSRFRRIETEPEDATLPSELREVTETFVTMAHTIQREEAELENSLREKDLLLREVYHRVRNNLQLISSMNNMQIRAAGDAETKRVLRRLQDRIMALSTIHASLYQAPALSKIRADELVAALARQVATKAASGIEIEVKAEMSETRLYPDLAVPLALLTVEAVTNAVKHLGAPSDGSPPWIAVRLSEDDGLVRLEICNSVAPGARYPETPDSGGLGQKLIDAFTVQLAAELEIEETAETYTLTVEFRPSDYGEEHSLI